VAYDVRRAEPYAVYPRLQFSVPTARAGDSWDRYWVRMEEMRQSLHILEQCLEQIQPGPISGRTRTVIRPPKGEAYVRTEAPRGDFGVYLVTEENKEQPYRLKVRSPSFCNLMALDILLRDTYVADVVTILGSLDIILGEVDR
jgi:NADH-quinone oxidoreductase subunit D